MLNHLLDDVNYQRARRLVSCFTKLARKEGQRVFFRVGKTCQTI